MSKGFRVASMVRPWPNGLWYRIPVLLRLDHIAVHWLVRIVFGVVVWEFMARMPSQATGSLVVYLLGVIGFAIDLWRNAGATRSLWRFYAEKRDAAGHRAGFWLQVVAGAAVSIVLLYVLLSTTVYAMIHYIAALGLGAMTLAVPMDRAGGACEMEKK